jgi:tetratricopeptide (TPR) repeat protein
MPNPEQSSQPDNRIATEPGDDIQATVEQAQNVAIGKNIVQNIAQNISARLDLPPWLVYALAATLFAALGLAIWLMVLTLGEGIPVTLRTAVAPTTAIIPTPPPCPPGRQCVLVADFAPAGDDLAGEITRKIRATLDNQALLSPDAFAVAPVTVVTGTAAAQQLAGQQAALVIIWGQIFRELKELNIHFALSEQFGVDESHTMRPYRVHYFEALTQQLVCEGDCFSDAASLRAVLDQISTVIAYTAAGMLHYAADQPETASDHFQAALFCSGQIDQMPSLPQLPLCLGGDPERQIQPIEGFNPAAVYYYAGKAGILAGDYALAIDYLQEAARRNVQDPAAWIAIATAYQSWLNQDDAPQAGEALAQASQRLAALADEMPALQTPQQGAAVDYELGFVAELANDLATAQEQYAAAAAGFGGDDPAAYVALVALGRVQQAAGQRDAAVATLQQAVGLDPGAPWAYLELAQAYRNDRRLAEEQIAAADRSPATQAYVPIVHGELCEVWQDDLCATQAYERALAIRPRSGWLHSRVGDYYRLRQNWVQAAVHYENAVRLRPHDPWAHERLAFAYLQQGKAAEAAHHYALSLDEYSHPETRLPERYCMLGQAQHAAQQLPAALASYQACLAGLPAGEQRSLVEGWIAQIEAQP